MIKPIAEASEIPVDAVAHSGADAPLFICNTCPALPLFNFANVVDPEAYKISPEVKLVNAVPPFATGNAPVTSSVRSTPPDLIVISRSGLCALSN